MSAKIFLDRISEALEPDPLPHCTVLVAIALLAVTLLSGCASKPQIVEVPVSVPCLGAKVEAPEYKAGVGEYPGDSEAIKMLAADLVQAKAYATALIARMAGCN